MNQFNPDYKADPAAYLNEILEYRTIIKEDIALAERMIINERDALKKIIEAYQNYIGVVNLDLPKGKAIQAAYRNAGIKW